MDPSNQLARDMIARHIDGKKWAKSYDREHLIDVACRVWAETSVETAVRSARRIIDESKQKLSNDPTPWVKHSFDPQKAIIRGAKGVE